MTVLLVAIALVGQPLEANPEALALTLAAASHPRKGSPFRLDLPIARIGSVAAKRLGDGPKRVMIEEIGVEPTPFAGQIERSADGERVRITFVPTREIPAGVERKYSLNLATIAESKSPWTLASSSSALDLKHGDKPVFRYNLMPVGNPDFPKVPARDAYLHPVYTPSGAVITGDFSKAHAHHRGIFLAYAKSSVGDLHPDFWNIHNGTGKIAFEKLESVSAGPVSARIVAKHRWEAKGAGEVLRETWEIEAYEIPGSPYWLFDLTSTQQAVKAPIELPTYRYGGMAYRGPDPFLATIDVLTSSGLDRKLGDQKPARWVDLTGPVAEGSNQYGGAMILDHPSNPHHPTPARIHPTTLPFFALTPSHDKALTIPADRPTVFRYRIVIHDGHPDGALDEQLWKDFAELPVLK